MSLPVHVSSLLSALGIFRFFHPRRGTSSGRLRKLDGPHNVGVIVSHNRGQRAFTQASNRLSEERRNLTNLVKVKTFSNPYGYPKIMCTNLRSIANKYEQTQIAMLSYKPDIAVFCETWITAETIDAFQIACYSSYHCVRSRPDKHHGGGVSVFVRDCFSVLQSRVCEIEGLEVVTVMCRPSVIPRYLPWFAFIAAYYPPSDKNCFAMSGYLVSEVDRLLSINTNAAIFVLGDLNGLDTSNILRLNNFSQILTSPNRKNNILTKCFTNAKYKMEVSLLPPIATSDHNVVLICPPLHSPISTPAKTISFRQNRNSDRISMANALNNIDWEYLNQFLDVQLMADQFYDHLTLLSNIMFPIVTKSQKDYGHPWIDNNIITLFKRRQVLLSMTVRDQVSLDRVQLQLKHSISIAKNSFCNKLQYHLNKSTPQFYKYINSLTNPNSDAKPNVNNCIIFKNSDLTESNNSISNYFSSILNKHCPIDLVSVLQTSHSSTIPLADPLWVADQLRSIKNGSHAPDEIPNFIYNHFFLFLTQPITDMINLSISQGCVPTQWKNSFLIPIPKISNPTEPSQLRPICISSPVGKICERHILRHLLLKTAGNIDPFQFGGLPKRSTAQYLAIYLHTVSSHLENSRSKVTSIFTDFHKAFDNVDHNRLLHQLQLIDTPQCFVNWISSFLSQRSITLKNGNELLPSSTILNTNGLPQGSVLGSFLFAVFTNNFALDFPNRLKYVDDISIIINSSSSDQTNLPQSAFDSLINQSCSLALPLNVSKCKSIIHCFSKSATSSLISSNHIVVQEVNGIKLLGVFIQGDLKWDQHICNIVKSANKRLYMLYTLRRLHASRECLLKCYYTYIRPLLEYCSPVWCYSINAKQRDTIECVQKRVCRIVMGLRHDSYEKDMTFLNMISLEQRRFIAAKKFASSFATEFPNLLPSKRGAVSGRITRQSDKLNLPPCRTNRFKFSPLMAIFRNLNQP